MALEQTLSVVMQCTDLTPRVDNKEKRVSNGVSILSSSYYELLVEGDHAKQIRSTAGLHTCTQFLQFIIVSAIRVSS